MGTEGDSFFVVFPTAGAAVAAAVQAQRGLEEPSLAGGERLRVRIGIHTGSPQVHEGDYWGMDVHRAARIAGSAHGGQVVMSAVTAELARAGAARTASRCATSAATTSRTSPNPSTSTSSTSTGLKQDFPPLRTLGTSSSLPIPATPLVGRETDLVAELTDTAAARRTSAW